MSSAVVPDRPPRIPPGAKDLPYDDGEPMETSRHYNQATILIHSLRYGWKDRQDFFVGGNMFMYFSETQVRKNDFRGPDVFVVLDTTPEDRLSWVVWEEDGKTPEVVIELLSDSTAAIDRGKKKEIYARQLHVPCYYLFHPLTWEFEGFELDSVNRVYRPLSPMENGDLPCPVLGLSLGVREGTFLGLTTNWLRWIGPDGIPFPTGEDLAQAAQRNAEAAQRNAEAAQQNAEVAQQNAEAARKEATAAKEEVLEERRRRDEEAERTAALARTVAEYQKRFGDL